MPPIVEKSKETDAELIATAQSLDDLVNVVECFSVQDVAELERVTGELERRGYTCTRRLTFTKEESRPAFRIGQKVHYHPVIGQPHDGTVYQIRTVDQLPGGLWVAWLQGKSGCVSIDAISPVEED